MPSRRNVPFVSLLLLLLLLRVLAGDPALSDWEALVGTGGENDAGDGSTAG
jgi:hypothetical protein